MRAAHVPSMEPTTSAAQPTRGSAWSRLWSPRRERRRGQKVQFPDPVLDYAGLVVVWSALPARLLDQVHSIPRRLDSARRHLNAIAEHANDPEWYFSDRMRKYAELGIYASKVSKLLRTEVGLTALIDPDSQTLPYLNERFVELTHLDEERTEREREAMAAFLAMATAGARPEVPK